MDCRMTCVPMPFCGTETLKLSVCISLPMVLKQSVYPNSIKKIYSVRSIYILIYVIIFSVVKKIIIIIKSKLSLQLRIQCVHNMQCISTTSVTRWKYCIILLAAKKTPDNSRVHLDLLFCLFFVLFPAFFSLMFY